MPSFDFLSAPPKAATPHLDPFATAPASSPQPPVSSEAQKYVPKNKDADDAWVKGAAFIDLVGLGMKGDTKSKPKEEPLIIKPL